MSVIVWMINISYPYVDLFLSNQCYPEKKGKVNNIVGYFSHVCEGVCDTLEDYVSVSCHSSSYTDSS